MWRHPWRTWVRLDLRTRRLLLAWGALLALMNSCFYLAIDRLPLGTVAAIEFLPVVGLAALAARTARNGLALLLAVAGVYVCDQLAMSRLSRPTYSLMVSLLPATATAIGVLVLAQVPSVAEVTGVALVVGGVALHRERKPADEGIETSS